MKWLTRLFKRAPKVDHASYAYKATQVNTNGEEIKINDSGITTAVSVELPGQIFEVTMYFAEGIKIKRDVRAMDQMGAYSAVIERVRAFEHRDRFYPSTAILSYSIRQTKRKKAKSHGATATTQTYVYRTNVGGGRGGCGR